MPKLHRALLLATALIFGVPGLPLAQLAPDATGQVVEIEVPASALAGNLLGTSAIQDAAIYLPPSYESAPDRRYPVIYLLHGIFDDFGAWIENEDVPARLNRLIAAKAMPEVLVVMPNAGNKYGGGYYRNSPISGNWADYIADDLIGHVDAEFRTMASADSRAVVGHSMGGYGAINLAISRPGKFSVVWAMSPCCLAATDDFGFGNDAWKRAASVQTVEDVENLLADKDFYAIALLGIVSAFSTEAGDPPVYGDVPFDIVRGEVVLEDAAYDRFLDSLPTRQLRAARDDLRALRGFGLGVGLGDQFLHIPPGTIELSQRLGAERIPHLLDVHDGDHRQNVGGRLETFVFPWVGALLVVAE